MFIYFHIFKRAGLYYSDNRFAAMDPGTVSLFQRVSEKLGWDSHGDLDQVEEKV